MNFITEWKYSQKAWDEFVTIERANKKEDNIYFGVAIAIFGTIALMFLRGTSLLTGLLFSIPLAVLIPYLRMRFSYLHLKKGITKPRVQIYSDRLVFNDKSVELTSKRKRIKNIKIIDAKNNTKLLEFDVQWITGKGPTNDEFRILIPSDKLEEAKEIVNKF